MCGSICFWQMKSNYEVFCLLVAEDLVLFVFGRRNAL